MALLSVKQQARLVLHCIIQDLLFVALGGAGYCPVTSPATDLRVHPLLTGNRQKFLYFSSCVDCGSPAQHKGPDESVGIPRFVLTLSNC